SPPTVPVFTPSSSRPTIVQSEKTVPKTCGGLAPPTEGSDPPGTAVTGPTLPVVGGPGPKIARSGPADCCYGVPHRKSPPDAGRPIGFAASADADAAKKRVASTVDTEREAGSKAADVQVGPDKGTLLNGARRMVVAARGKNTIVVSVLPELVPEEQA